MQFLLRGFIPVKYSVDYLLNVVVVCVGRLSAGFFWRQLSTWMSLSRRLWTLQSVEWLLPNRLSPPLDWFILPRCPMACDVYIITVVFALFVCTSSWVMFSHNGAIGPESKTFARWLHQLDIRRHFVWSSSPGGATSGKVAVHDCILFGFLLSIFLRYLFCYISTWSTKLHTRQRF